VVVCKLPKLETRVRFSYPAPKFSQGDFDLSVAAPDIYFIEVIQKGAPCIRAWGNGLKNRNITDSWRPGILPTTGDARFVTSNVTDLLLSILYGAQCGVLLGSLVSLVLFDVFSNRKAMALDSSFFVHWRTFFPSC